MRQHLAPMCVAYVLADTVAHFAQALEFNRHLFRDSDLVTSACYVSVAAEVGSDVGLRPPAGHY
eukprot:5750803-Alexandrium_andersonii.AAC.1